MVLCSDSIVTNFSVELGFISGVLPYTMCTLCVCVRVSSVHFLHFS